jgi:transposase-like protein
LTKSGETAPATASREDEQPPRRVTVPADPRERSTAADGSLGPDPRRRRRFTAAHKLRILREADGCREPGEISALLRREGLYSSHLALWRRQREEAAHAELDARKRGPKPQRVDARLEELERENARLHQRLKDLERMLRKAAAILASQRPAEGETDPPAGPHRIA